jgi:predicted PurR-regulated permease PerM
MMVADERAWAQRIGDNFLQAVGGYVRGNLLISVIAGAASYVVLRIIGTPYPETLAVFVALFDIIPLVGATIAAVVVILVGLATGGTVDGIVLLVYFIAYQQFENNVLQNLVYAKTVALSPLVVFIAALMGASLLGIVGVLLAIPIASAAWVLGRDLLQMRRERRERAELAGEAAVLPPPPGDDAAEPLPE